MDQISNSRNSGEECDGEILSDGLVNLYSSQAEVMLSQYEHINYLLGPTHDWTHPGTLCEELLRDYLRKTLVPGVSADKGYIYGRAVVAGKPSHCPEIDVLIHETRRYRPVYEMGDLVIVRPESVLGIIQVKRRFSSGQVTKGIRNVVAAKYLLNSLLVAKYSNPISPFIFSGVVGFEDDISEPRLASDFYGKVFNRHFRDLVKTHGVQKRIALRMLPDFIGSIRQQYAFHPLPEERRAEYYNLSSVVPGKNVVPQTISGLLNNMISSQLRLNPDDNPPVAFPREGGRRLYPFFITDAVTFLEKRE